MIKIFFLLSILFLSVSWLIFLTWSAPVLKNSDSTTNFQLTFPSTLEELRQVYRILQIYSVDHHVYVLVLFSSAYIFKQTFCIPGSLFLNMLSGALYGKVNGLLLACCLTAVGASLCYLLSKYFIKEWINHTFPSQIKDLENKVTNNKDRLMFFMMFLRLVPVMPGWVLNLVAPLAGIPIHIFFFTALIGLGPYNFVGVSSGEVLSSVSSVSEILTWQTMLNMAGIALVAIIPAFILKKRHIKSSKL